MSGRSLGNIRRAFAPWNDPEAKPLVEFRGVTKCFGDVVAVDALSLTIYPREFFALLGPSGCGKTTLMRMLAGFEEPSEGDILLDGISLAGVPPHRRPTNMMFQSYALFPHMSVAENVGYGLKQEGIAKAERDARVADALALVKLDAFARRRPDQLSGGQKQRVALARALVKRPKVLLLDEPLGALDRKLREATQYELMDLQAELGMTFLMVTHDQDEAMAMADRIAVMERGRIVQCAPPETIYENPVNRYVAEFVGDINILEGHVESVAGGMVTIGSPLARRIVLEETNAAIAAGDFVSVGIRPEKIAISHERPASANNCTEGEVWDIGYLGDSTMAQVKTDNGALIKVAVSNRARHAERPIAWEDKVWLSWDARAGILLKG